VRITETIRRVNVEQDSRPRFQRNAAAAILTATAGFLEGDLAIFGKDLTVNVSVVMSVNLAYHFSIL
jgi:hypothetical protein